MWFLFFLSCGMSSMASPILVVANGDFDRNVVEKHQGKDIMALDGASICLMEKKIFPNYILGDFDSIGEYLETKPDCDIFNFKDGRISDILSDFSEKSMKTQDTNLEDLEFLTYETQTKGEQKITLVKAECQNYTDLEKGIRFCFAKDYSSITVACALGGSRTDHLIGNLFLLRKMRRAFPEKQLIIETKTEIIEFLDENYNSLTFRCNIGDKFGIFGIDRARVESKGLEWELSAEYPLTIGLQDGHCNIVKSEQVSLTVQEGEVLVIRVK